MTERDLDDLWAVAFKLRNVLVLLENQLSGKDGSGVSPEQAVGKPPVPANPAGNQETVSPPPSGGGYLSPEDGVPLRYGDIIDNGRGGVMYFAGPCYVCGKAALTKYKTWAGMEGQHRCWPCFLKQKREAGR